MSESGYKSSKKWRMYGTRMEKARMGVIGVAESIDEVLFLISLLDGVWGTRYE